MYYFSNKSKKRLSTCDDMLQEICYDVIKIMDFSVLAGYRNEEDQNTAYAEGNSKLRYPHSKHNKYPSQAVDIAPYPIDWNDRTRFALLAGVMFGVALGWGNKLRWGGDWDGDFNLKDNKFADLGHFEII